MTRIVKRRPIGFGLWRFVSTIFIIGLATAALAGRSEAARVQRVVSPGGIVAWLVESPTVPLIRLAIGINGGTSQDPDDKPGVAYFTTWMFDEGAGDMDTAGLNGAMKRLGATHNKDVGAESIDVTFAMLSENADASFDILRQMFTTPRFDDDAMARARAETIRDIESLRRNPTDNINQHLFELIYPAHPYSKPRRGTPEALATITRTDIEAYRGKVFARDNLTIGVVGNIDAATLAKQLDKVFGALPAKAELKPIPAQTTLPAREKAIADDVRQTNIAFGYALEERLPLNLFPAMNILNHVLSGGILTSRLQKEVRVKRGLVYGINFGVWQALHGQYVSGSFGAEPATAEEAYKVTREVIGKLAEDGLTADELQNAKTYLEGTYVVNLSDSASLANELVNLQRYGESLDSIDRYASDLKAVTLEDMRKLASQVLKPAAISRVSVGPLKQAGAAEPQKEATK